MEKNLKKSSSILGIKQLNVLERNAVRGGIMNAHHHDHGHDDIKRMRDSHQHQHQHHDQDHDSTRLDPWHNVKI